MRANFLVLTIYPLNVNLSTFIKQTAGNSYCSVQGQYWGATNNIEEDI